MENANQPALDYWMFNTIVDALQKEYDRYKKQSGITSQLAHTAKTKGVDFAKECEKEVCENRYHPLGQIWQSKRRVEEMREFISTAALTLLSQNKT
jgi:hypothetical protein